MNPQDHAYALPVGYMLEEYRIEGMLGSGGFGMTYLAHDMHLDKRVALKEYLPNEFAVRDAGGTVGPKSSAEGGNYQWGLERFLEEAQVLAGFDHAHINKVYRRFQAHGTAYLVLEYISGETLSERLRRTRVLPPEEALRLFTELLSGLEVVHRRDYVHRDIKPGNIMLREGGASVLLDFGAARQLVGQRSKSITSLLTPGYAPIEQYDSKAAHVGPWSDFYALGVTAYCCVTGVNEGALLDATARMVLLSRGEAEQDMRPAIEAARGGYDRRLLEAIDGCMKVDGRERPQSVGALRALLGEGSEPVPPKPPPRPDEDKDKGKDKGKDQGKYKPSPLVTFAVCAVCFLWLGLWGASKGLFSPSRPVSPAPVGAPAREAAPPAPAREAAPRRRVAERAVGAVFRDALRSGGEGPEMVVLPTGRFRMGDLDGSGDSEERPVHTVTISRPIAMGRYPVTFEDYDLYVSAMGAEQPHDEGWGRGRRPVINVSQEDAKAYAAWLSTQTGKNYRLPSESEWEYAARAGTRTRYSWGDSIACSQARYGRRPRGECSNSEDGTVPVGSFAANAFGLFDMHGNVEEWVEDCWHGNYEGAPSDGSAWTTDCVNTRGGSRLAVVRGGSWYLYPRNLRAANRFWVTPSYRFYDNGFRLVQDLNPFPEAPGSLVLELAPSDARVILPDIEPRYRSGMALSTGEYRVVVRKAGYEEFTGTVRIMAGQRTTRSIVLRREVPDRAVGEVFQDALTGGGEGPQMVVLPTGSFRMGSPSDEEGRDDDEGPLRTVNMSRRIAMGRYEVTVGEFRRFVTASGYRTEAERNAGGQGCRTVENTTRNTWDWTPGRFWLNLEYRVEEDQPVVCVSWHDARRYIEWLNEETGGGYRLPSESEWEYAVRAGSVSRYHFGDDESELCRYGNVADTTRLPNGNVWTNKANCSDGAVYPTAVGSYRPNAFGLYDMHGNVWEWVADCYHDSYEGGPADGSAWTSGCGSDVRAVVRGGSWNYNPRNLRSANRVRDRPSTRSYNGGFRLVQDLNP